MQGRRGQGALPVGIAFVAVVALVATLAALTLTPPVAPVIPAGPARSARLVVEEGALYGAHVASGSVTRLRLPDGAVVWRAPLGCEPATLARSALRILVACADSGDLVALDAASGALAARVHLGHGAFGVLAAGERVFVTLPHDDAVVALRSDTLVEIARAATGREPRGLALARGRLSVVHLLDASVRRYDPVTLAPAGTIEIGQQAALAESITPHPTAPRLYVAHQRLNLTNLDRHFDTTVFPIVSALDTDAGEPVRREALALDSVDTPVGMPLATALSEDGTRLYAVNGASDDVSVVDLARGIGTGHVVVGERPRDLALSPDGTRLYTLNQLSNDVSVIDTTGAVGATSAHVIATLALAPDPRPAAIRRGERLFTTSRPETVARDHWIACASCHLDGGFDGGTWLGGDEGVRNTTILRGTRGTEPLHWSGTRADVRAFQKTITGLMAGTGLAPSDLDALQAFIDSLTPLASPRRSASGALTRSAQAGASVFRRAGCESCHTPPLFTDRALHDVGTGAAFDTPSLRELWLSAPFLHDGRAPTLASLFTGSSPHGGTALGPSETLALVAFLESLPLDAAETARLFPR